MFGVVRGCDTTIGKEKIGKGEKKKKTSLRE